MSKIRFIHSLLLILCLALSLVLASEQQVSKKMGANANGERYKGSYKNGKKHGHGTWIHPDGDSYKGKFIANLKRGYGKYTFQNGEEYLGHYKRDVQHGLGQYTYNNGEIFTGEYKNNIRNGQGFLVFKGDTIKSGIWEKNKFIKKIKLKNVTRYIKMTYPKYKKSKHEPSLTVETNLTLPDNNETLETNETAELTIRITNTGKGKAQGIETFIEKKNLAEGLIINNPEIIRSLNPGESKTVKATIFASDMMISQQISLSVIITEYFGHDAPLSKNLSLKTKSLTSPDLVLTKIKINDQSNKNGLIEPAEIIEATIFISNKGQQVAKDVNIDVLYGDYVFNTGKSSFKLGDIKQNQKKKIEFSFFAMSEAEKQLPISFEIKESRSKFDQIIPSGLGLNSLNNTPN